jgi:N12 class adenine-specific DNA methylase
MDLAPAGERAKASANLAALAVLRRIQDEDRSATTDEQQALARWSSWGALPGIFDEANDRWSAERSQLRSLLDDVAWDAARRTTVNAHYTDAGVVAAVWDAVSALGFEGGRAIEPGCGSGNFIGLAPDQAAIEWVGVELDPTTAAIAGLLYPHAEIRAEGFEATRFPAGTFDLAVGNVPFGNFRVHDPLHNPGRHNIHNHFIVKSLDLVRPGGLVAVITSRYTMDAANPAAREDMAARADLIGAMRLPQGTFRAAAGTDAITDLLVFRRRAEGEAAPPAPWIGLGRLHSEGVAIAVDVNSWFLDHPEMVIGQMGVGAGQYRADDLTVRPPEDGDVAGAARRALDLLVDRARTARLVYTARADGDGLAPVIQRRAPADAMEGAILPDGGGYATVRFGVLTPHPVPQSQRAELDALMSLRDTVAQLVETQAATNDDAAVSALQARLNGQYDAYRADYGPLNRFKLSKRENKRTAETTWVKVFPQMGGFRRDPAAALVFALEHFDEETGEAAKSAVFSRRVVAPRARPSTTSRPADALALCLDELGRPDLDRIASLLETTPELARTALGTLVWEDPSDGQLVTAETYLSGNVRAKLDAARAAAAADPAWTGHVEALEAVIPPDLGPDEIDARPGAPWIPPSDIKDFMSEVLGADTPEVTYEAHSGTWRLAVGPGESHGVVMREQWGTERRSAVDLLTHACKQTTPTVKTTVGDREVLDAGATLEARAKLEELVDRFGGWVWEDPARSERLAAAYNQAFRSHRLMQYDGSHLQLPGLAEGFRPHSHQRDAVWRIVSEPTTLLAHAVGAGKTATMVMGAMELRRLGLATKPAIVVPNHMLEQFTREAQQLYPQGRFLSAGSADLENTKSSPDTRRRFVAQCALGDWDAVIITHDAFTSIPVSAQEEAGFVRDAGAELRAAHEAAVNDRAPKATVKELEKAVMANEASVRGLLASAAKDDGVSFGQSGIDYLFVDEAHRYKNRRFATRIRELPRPKPAQRSEDMALKLHSLRARHGARIATFATATPIANSVSEMYTMQMYLQPELMKEVGISHFDSWAAQFGSTVTSMELSVDGQSYEQKTRFARFRNVPELVDMFSLVADVRSGEDLALDVPSVAGGGPTNVLVPPTDELADFMADIEARSERIQARMVDPSEDNMLKVNNDGRYAALDLRLVERPAASPTKAEIAADHIATIYERTRHNRYQDPATGQLHDRPGALQIVFCDLGTPKAGWSVYSEVRDQLIERGVPADRIRFVHDAADDRAKAKLFAACREGRVSVLIGSTEKMGVGTNIQARAAALHHLDCPYRPADLEQREGRIIRQGNQHGEVQILRYATERSLDTRMWQIVERKAQFIHQVTRGRVTEREIDDVGETALSYAEIKALSSGNEAVIELATVDAELVKLTKLHQRHAGQQRALTSALASALGHVERADAAIERADAAIAQRVDTTGDLFRATIGGHVYEERVEAGRALAGEVRRHLTTYVAPTNAPIGHLGGFDLAVKEVVRGSESRVVLSVVDTDQTVSYRRSDLEVRADALVRRVENQIASLDDVRSRQRARATAARAEADIAQGRIGLPFKDADRLEQLRRRKAELELELSPPEPAGGTEGDSPTASTEPAERPGVDVNTADHASTKVAQTQVGGTEALLKAIGDDGRRCAAPDEAVTEIEL